MRVLATVIRPDLIACLVIAAVTVGARLPDALRTSACAGICKKTGSTLLLSLWERGLESHAGRVEFDRDARIDQLE